MLQRNSVFLPFCVFQSACVAGKRISCCDSYRLHESGLLYSWPRTEGNCKVSGLEEEEDVLEISSARKYQQDV